MFSHCADLYSSLPVPSLCIGVFKESFAKFTVDAKPIDPTGRGTVKAIV
ncbi:unnamed protein product, partial [Dibothriocephalus latus]